MRYPVMEHFYTLQGEGRNSGRAAYFVRLGGCDVGCVWCDVKESWKAEDHPSFETEEIVEWVKSSGAPLCVITGGEPLMYDLSELTRRLDSIGVEIAIETSGAHPFSGSWHWVCLSPKKFKKALPDSYQFADELKVVVYHPSDLQWAEEEAAKVKENCLLYLQPEWDKREKVTPLVLDYIKANPKWRLSLQTHKYLNIP